MLLENSRFLLRIINGRLWNSANKRALFFLRMRLVKGDISDVMIHFGPKNEIIDSQPVQN